MHIEACSHNGLEIGIPSENREQASTRFCKELGLSFKRKVFCLVQLVTYEVEKILGCEWVEAVVFVEPVAWLRCLRKSESTT